MSAYRPPPHPSTYSRRDEARLSISAKRRTKKNNKTKTTDVGMTAWVQIRELDGAMEGTDVVAEPDKPDRVKRVPLIDRGA
jgi:hypothetical protein